MKPPRDDLKLLPNPICRVHDCSLPDSVCFTRSALSGAFAKPSMEISSRDRFPAFHAPRVDLRTCSEFELSVGAEKLPRTYPWSLVISRSRSSCAGGHKVQDLVGVQGNEQRALQLVHSANQFAHFPR